MGTLTQGLQERTPERDRDLISELLKKHVFPEVPESELALLVEAAEEEFFPAGRVLAQESEQLNVLMILLEGRVRISRSDAHGHETFWKTLSAPDYMGEVAMLSNQQNPMRVTAETDTRGLRVEAEDFWRLMSVCHGLRAAVLAVVRYRVRGMQSFAAQQEKLATLGTLTAGLMHELNNPGSAARRAASQLRANLTRMHELARTIDSDCNTPEQHDCLYALQERILKTQGTACLSSLQQTDAEEALAEWLTDRGVEDGWSIAPVLVNSELSPTDLQCIGEIFPGKTLAHALHWLEAIASSVQMTELVEESVTRVSELAQAVKSYAHEGQGGMQDVDVNESIHATLVILKHKFREKNIHLEKQFGGKLPKLRCMCSGLNQVWTNLLDNAIDAVGPEGHIRIRTWSEGEDLLIGIGDDGIGIPAENQERIFDPFFTTKSAGIGTGLGLGIVQRVLDSYNASLTLRSKPGDTEFLVRIPLEQGA